MVVYDSILAGNYLIKTETSETLQRKYYKGIGTESFKQMYQRVSLYNIALSNARLTAYEFDMALLEAIANSPQSNRNAYIPGNNTYGTTVYSRDECIGPVIMGECKGTIVPKGGYHKKCYGQMLNGQCTGPMF